MLLCLKKPFLELPGDLVVKDLVLSLLWLWLLLWFRFNPWSGNLCILQVCPSPPPKKKEKQKKSIPDSKLGRYLSISLPRSFVAFHCQVFNLLTIDFCDWYMLELNFGFFSSIWIPNCPSTIYWKIKSFHRAQKHHPCYKSASNVCVGLLVSTLVYFCMSQLSWESYLNFAHFWLDLFLGAWCILKCCRWWL